MNTSSSIIHPAKYRRTHVDAYEDNPLIECLPPLPPPDSLAHLFSHYPKLPTSKTRKSSLWARIQLVGTLGNVIIANPEFRSTAMSLSRLMRAAYVSRNPLFDLEERRCNMIANHDHTKKLSLPIDWKHTAEGYLFKSSTGSGKTTFVNAFLARMPQVVSHENYKGQRLVLTQIVYLKLSIPPDGSLKALCLTFFVKIDQLIGSNYYAQAISESTIPRMTILMGKVATLVSLGTLFIDELQNLRNVHKESGERVLNMFVDIVETYGIAVVLMTTPASTELLERHARNTRKLTLSGTTAFDNMRPDSPDWLAFTDELWNYSYTRVLPELTPRIRQAWFNSSGGNRALAASAFRFAQEFVIADECEWENGVDEEVFSLVLKTKMAHLKPAIDALKSGSIARLAKFDDYYSAGLHSSDSKLFVATHTNIVTPHNENIPVDEFLELTPAADQPQKTNATRSRKKSIKENKLSELPTRSISADM